MDKARDARELVQKSRTAILGRECPRALLKIKKAIITNPEDSKAYGRWARFLCKQKRYEEANAKYARASIIDPKSLRVYLNWGQMLYNQDKWDQAAQKYQKAHDINPYRRKTLKSLGWALFRQGNLIEATNVFDRAIELYPNDWMFFSNKGIMLYNQGAYEAAIVFYKKALEIDSTNSYSQLNIELALRHLNRHEEAEAMHIEVMRHLELNGSHKILIESIEEEIRVVNISKDQEPIQVQSEHSKRKLEVLCHLLEQIKGARAEA